MAAFDFPASPTLNQAYTANGVTYLWNGQAWVGGPQPVANVGMMNLPEGMVFQWLADSPPAGTLELNGALVSRTTYSKLFALWGTKYGAGDGSTTFGLPNTKGTTFVGKDSTGSRLATASGYNATAVGNVFGAQTYVLDLTQIPSHAHASQDHWHYTSAHQHSIAYSNSTSVISGGSGFVRGNATGFSTLFTQVDGASSTGWLSGSTGIGFTGAQGGGGAHGNVQPSFVALHVVTTGGQ